MDEIIALKLVDWVNRETGLKLIFKRFEGSNLLCADVKRRRFVIRVYGAQARPVVRSVLREKRAGRGFGWLPNGQAGRNAVEVHYWDEDHRYTIEDADLARLRGTGLMAPAPAGS